MLLAVAVPSARAEGDPLAGGATELTLAKRLQESLKHGGVKLVAKRPAKSSGRTTTLPVDSGEIDPTTGEGFATHRGAIGFVRGRRSLFLRSMGLDTKRRVLTARLGGKETTVALARKISFVRKGYGTKITVGELRLTGSLARKLNSRLQVRFFKAGRSFARGSTATEPLTVKVIPVTPGIHGEGLMYLRPLDEVVSKLAVKGVIYPEIPCSASCSNTVSLIGNVQYFGTGHPAIGLHITGGRIAPDRSTGNITTEGGIRVSTNDPEIDPAVVSLRDFSLDLAANVVTADVEFQPSPPAPGDIGRVTVGTIDRNGIKLAGIGDETFDGVRLTAGAASVINQVFPGPAAADFSAGEVLFSMSYEPVTR
ncbi:MAG TPA: hypothetical protein VFJ64_09645 [Solirubrobacterales bacterium]|nr:hypothetical protein [Solirubrobacterales bacterium]